MLFKRRKKRIDKHHQAWLYSAVYRGRFSTLIVLALFFALLIQPIHQALASEPAPAPTPPPVAQDVQPQATESPPVQESPPSVTSPPSSEATAPKSLSEPVTTTGTSTYPVSVSTSTPQAENPPPVTPPPHKQPVEKPTSTSTTPDEVPLSQQNPNSSSTEVVKIQNLVTDENFYQFSKQSCVEVGSGVFNCTSRKNEVDNSQSVVYAEKDAGGDMEIFLKTSKGNIKQITSNDYDDTDPNYDPESMRVVWQRLVDGRQQIMEYNIMDNKETQLTYSKTNNMEPKVSKSGIVWQAWDNNDWEVMFFDGSYTEQITNNDVQDVAPVIQDKYILWNVLGGKEQQARVYSLATKETVPIQGYEGGSIINPRFVLLYDTQFANGDVVTQTFDPITGLSKPVAAKPAPAPVQIPNTDPTGEIRALITGKTQKDEKDMGSIQTDGSGAGDGNGTISGHGVLNLSASSTDAIVAPAISTTTDFELTEYDLVIPQGALKQALDATTSSTQ